MDLQPLWTTDDDYWFGDDEIAEPLAELFEQRTADEWFALFAAAAIPACPVLEVSDLVDHPHLRARGLVLDQDGPVPAIVDPVRWVDRDARPGAGARTAPSLGGDTDDVLARWLR
jgi:formyl-CoA transferase